MQDGGGGEETAVRKGPWTMEEDLILANYVAVNGEGDWNSLARAAGTSVNWATYLFIDRVTLLPFHSMHGGG
jgi:hypothetical protein